MTTLLTVDKKNCWSILLPCGQYMATYIEHLEGVVCSISAPRWDEIIRTGSVAEDVISDNDDSHSDNGGEYGACDYDEGQDSATIMEYVDEAG